MALGAAARARLGRRSPTTRCRAGTLVAFLSTALALRWPVESLGWLLSISNESATAADRYFEVMDTPLPAELGHAGPPSEPDERAPGSGSPAWRFRYPDAPTARPTC